MARGSWLLAVLVFATGGCSPDQAAARPATPPAGPANAPAADPLASLPKDGGKPWEVDDHTRNSIAAMVATVQRKAGDPSTAGTAALGKELRENVDGLIRGCTMGGPAHFALHGYLAPLLTDIEAMIGADAAAAQRARAEAAAILARFGEFFR